MAKDKNVPSAALDQTLSPAERAEALHIHDGHMDDDGEDTSVAVATKKQPLPPIKALAGKKKVDDSLIPDLKAIYGEDAEVISTQFKTLVGVKLDTNKEKKPTRVRESVLPKSIYTQELNPQLINLVFHFLKPVMQPDEIKTFTDLAAGRNTHPVTMIREGLWNMLWHKRDSISLEGAPEDRTVHHDDEEEFSNQQLILLLEFDIFDALNSRARGYGCSAATAFGYILRNALLRSDWDMR